VFLVSISYFLFLNLKQAYLNKFKIYINKITKQLILAYIASTLGWTINGKNNTETNFVVGVTMTNVYVAEKDGHRKAKLI